MANTIQIARPGFDFSAWVSANVASFKAWQARNRVYRETYSELSQLNDRELNDLGIARSEIARLAAEAADKA